VLLELLSKSRSDEPVKRYSEQIFDVSDVLVNLNKSLADELNQPTSFLTACSNKKNLKNQ